MNDPGGPHSKSDRLRSTNQGSPGAAETGNEKSRGPNLVLAYGLMAVALLVAIALALLIVLPFYRRR